MFLAWSELYKLRFYHSIFEMTVGLFSYIVNFLLIYMAMYKSNRYMRAYRVIIVMNCCVDLFYNTISVCIQVVVDMKDGGLYFMNGYFLEWVPQPYACYMHNFWMFGLLLAVLNVPVQFVFRYCILCKNRVLTVKELCVLLFIPAIFVAIHCCYGVKAYMVTEEHRKLAIHSLEKDPLWGSDVPVFSHGFVKDYPVQVDFAGSQGVVILAYVVIFFTGKRIYDKLQASQSIMSPQTKMAQAQLSKILLIEAAMPFLVMGVPITFCIIAVIFGFNIPLIGLGMATLASCIPLVNGICIIAIVPSYRRCFKQMIFMKTDSSKTDSTIGAQTVAFITGNPIHQQRRLAVSSPPMLMRGIVSAPPAGRRVLPPGRLDASY